MYVLEKTLTPTKILIFKHITILIGSSFHIAEVLARVWATSTDNTTQPDRIIYNGTADMHSLPSVSMIQIIGKIICLKNQIRLSQ